MMPADEILNTLHTLYDPDDVIEIRIIRKKGKSKSTDSGYYDYAHFEKCAEDILKIDGLPGVPAIYCTVNPVQKILLARSHNRLTQGADSTTNGEQIRYRKYLPFDIDPVRPTGTSSTDEMHDRSIEKAHEVKQWLADKGFHKPIVADSGNGAHLLYRIDEPNTPEAKELIENVQKAVITALNHPDKDGIDIQGFADANRIWKVYGTITKKGDEIQNLGIRHRRSKLLKVPDNIQIVSTEILKKVGDLYEKYVDEVNRIPSDDKLKQQSNRDKFDIEAWMDKYNIHVVRTKHERGKIIYVLETCPLNSDHSGNKEAVIIQEDSGRLGFKCHHNSCNGKQWIDVREKYEPGYNEPKTDKIIYEEPPDDKEINTEHLDNYSNNILDIANKLLDEGDAFRFIVDVWNTKHVGDRGIGEACACAVGATYIKNSAGLHMKPSGQSGKGKSDGSKKFVHLLPDCKKMIGSLSGKAPFYSDDLKEGVVIYSDDARLNEDIISTIKQATTYFQTETIHRTVNIKRKGEVLTIPPRLSWWITNVDSFDDDQMGNRFLTMDVDAGPEQDEAVFKHQKECHLKGMSEEEVTDEDLICRAIYELLNQNTYHIVVPFLNCIEWDNKDNRRNFQMFIDIIEAVTLYRYRQCDKIGDIYLSELQDYERAKHIYNTLVATHTTNLSEIELKIMRFMEAMSEAEIMQIAKQINRGRTATHKYLHGANGNGGLLEKIPGLDIEKVTIREEGSERSTHKNIYYYQVSQSKYGIESFSSVVGINMDRFNEEVNTEKLRLSRLSPTVTPLSPQKRQSNSLSVDIYNKYILYNSNMYGESGIDTDKYGLIRNKGESGDSHDSEATDNGTQGDSQGDSDVTVSHLPKTAQKQLIKDLITFKKANYSMTGIVDPGQFTVHFCKLYDKVWKDKATVVLDHVKKLNGRGWK